MNELQASKSDWTSYTQLVQQLITGNVRRNTFTQWEMRLLLDLQMTRMRKSSRPDILRRYLKLVDRSLASGMPVPPRFARFFETEHRPRGSRLNLEQQVVATAVELPRAS